jgi:hypothetical protein
VRGAISLIKWHFRWSARTCDAIYFKGLQPATMLRSHQRTKPIADAGRNGVLSIIALKAICPEKRGGNRAGTVTAQACSG